MRTYHYPFTLVLIYIVTLFFRTHSYYINQHDDFTYIIYCPSISPSLVYLFYLLYFTTTIKKNMSILSYLTLQYVDIMLYSLKLLLVGYIGYGWTSACFFISITEILFFSSKALAPNGSTGILSIQVMLTIARHFDVSVFGVADIDFAVGRAWDDYGTRY